MRQASPFSHPLYALIKPVGSSCNLACSYCYYQPKGVETVVSGPVGAALAAVPPSSPVGAVLAAVPPQAGKTRMSPSLLDLFTRQYIEAQTQREVLFTWHGGEPTLLPIGFYEQALTLQQRYAGRHVCDNAIQTNGTLLTDDYCRFLHDHHFLVGLSLDGPEALHNAHRFSRHGQPSWQRVMKAVEMLERHSVEWNAMAVVTPLTAQHTTEFYNFFRQIGCRFLQCTPLFQGTSTLYVTGRQPDTVGAGLLCTEGKALAQLAPIPQHAHPSMGGTAARAAPTESSRWWGAFLCDLWDEWYAHDVGRLFISLFESVIANRCGVAPGLCTLAPTCGDALVVEANGDVYSCDHFADSAHRLGNIRTRTLLDMAYGPEQQAFRRLKSRLAPACHACPWLTLCHGECPANRLPDGRSYLCDGYRQFFQHAAPDIEQIAAEWAHL